MTALAQGRYLADAVATASPARLVTMLYDRLMRDLEQGEAALRRGEAAAAGQALGHAQEIVLELRAALRPEAWSGGPALASLYGYVVSELFSAQLAKDPGRVAACTRLVEPLADAWREAAVLAATPAGLAS